MLIKSKENKIFKWVKSLTHTKTRKKEKVFLLEGVTFVKEALQDYSHLIDFVILGEGFSKSEKGKEFVEILNKKKILFYIFSSKLIKELTSTETPQGIFAVVKQQEFSEWKIFLEESPNIVLIIEELQDPNNVGAVIRVADAVGVKAIFYTKGTADPYSLKAVRASAGSILHLPVIYIEESLKELILELKSSGFQIIATVTNNGKSLFQAEFQEKVAIIVGNEARGVSEKAKSLSDELITIPVYGKAQSLNVAVATGIILYEILHYRYTKFKSLKA